MQDVQLQFIAEALNSYMQDVVQSMQQSITKTKSVDTKTLLNNLRYKTYNQYAAGNANLSFAEWGRFLDMGVSKGHPLGGAKETIKQLSTTSKKRKYKQRNKKQKEKPKKRNPRKLYSPIVYGHLNRLISTIAYGFTEETITRIKNTIK